MVMKGGKIESISINGIEFRIHENEEETNNDFNKIIRPETGPIPLVELAKKHDWKTDNSAWKMMVDSFVKGEKHD